MDCRLFGLYYIGNLRIRSIQSFIKNIEAQRKMAEAVMNAIENCNKSEENMLKRIISIKINIDRY